MLDEYDFDSKKKNDEQAAKAKKGEGHVVPGCRQEQEGG